MKPYINISNMNIDAFNGVATIHDRAGFRALFSNLVSRAVTFALAESDRAAQGRSFRAKNQWEPSANQLQRGRALMLKEFRKPHNLTVTQFAEFAGKSRQQIYKELKSKRLLALSIGARGQRIPDWQLEPARKKLTQALLDNARDVDEWTLYYALAEPNEALAGKAPIRAVKAGNLDRILDVVLSQLGINC